MRYGESQSTLTPGHATVGMRLSGSDSEQSTTRPCCLLSALINTAWADLRRGSGRVSAHLTGRRGTLCIRGEHRGRGAQLVEGELARHDDECRCKHEPQRWLRHPHGPIAAY